MPPRLGPPVQPGEPEEDDSDPLAPDQSWGGGFVIGEARGSVTSVISNAEKAAIKRREAKKIPVGFQLPHKRRRR
jgi:hypothetical protein